MKKYLEIKPLEGLGNVKFGMLPSEVIKEMSEEQIYEDWMGGNLNDSLLFKGMILGFDKHNAYGPLENSRLSDMRINNRADISLFNKLIRDWKEKEFSNYCNQHNIKIIYYESGKIDLPELGLEIYFDCEDDSVWIEFWKIEN